LDNQQRRQSVTRPDGTRQEQLYQGSRLKESRELLAQGAEFSKLTYTYDPHGRRVQETDLRRGTTEYAFTVRDELLSVTLPAAKAGESPRTRVYQYDAMGRQTEEQLPDLTKTFHEYWPSGKLKKSWGANTYTQEYGYDAQGRQTSLVTAAGTTRWVFDPVTGLLSSKEYVSGQPADYTYTPAGRLKTTRSRGGELITYDYGLAGDLERIDYAADSAPDVTLSYDRLGRRRTVQDAAGLHTVDYDAQGRLVREALSGSGVLTGFELRTSYDALGRLSSYELCDASGGGCHGNSGTEFGDG
jgi:YD repeat-containing protein